MSKWRQFFNGLLLEKGAEKWLKDTGSRKVALVVVFKRRIQQRKWRRASG